MRFDFFIALLFVLISCGSKTNENQQATDDNLIKEDSLYVNFYFGADMSYVNEMEDCGALYKNLADSIQDPFKIFKEAGANIIRVRLWNNPTWTAYSDFDDVKKTISRAKEAGMAVLLDFHYSDTWADPAKQIIPEAWVNEVNNVEALGDLLYNYTYNTLNDLENANLLPEMVQIGNETNSMLLQIGESEGPIDWERNSYLLNKGIKAVRDISNELGKNIGVMLHIAQPENALWWFEQAKQHNVTDYDWIGLSYYPLWSEYTLENVSEAFSTLINTYKKRLMIVETAYPFTMENADSAGNILGNDALISGYPATQQGQLDYLIKLKQVIRMSGGEGLIYWEPAWVSTNCFTLWGQGSHWDNATLFDHTNKATLGMSFFNTALNE